MDTCKLCGSELIRVGKKWVCSNEECSFQVVIGQNSWFKELVKEFNGWNEINLMMFLLLYQININDFIN